MKYRIRKWLDIKDPVEPKDPAEYFHQELRKIYDALADVGFHIGEGGQVNVKGVQVKFSTRLDGLELRVKKLEQVEDLNAN
jgi:hypothetical protein